MNESKTREAEENPGPGAPRSEMTKAASREDEAPQGKVQNMMPSPLSCDGKS